MNKKILELIDKYDQDARKMRHYLHENPEVSRHEVETSQFLKQEARELGLEIEEVPKRGRSNGHGFIATLDTGKPGETIGLRTDIDALPMTEHPNNLTGPRTVISKNEGAMHACGHDGHMTTLMFTMRILHDLKDELTGKIIFIFEEGEENSGGIGEMVKLLESKEIDAIYGNHLAAFLDVGEVAADAGPIMTGAGFVDFKIIGRGGHGARPDQAINPVYVGVDVLNSISVVWNNQINIEKTVTLGISQFHAGTANNVFADEARIGGSIRYFDNEEGKRAYQLLMDTARKVADVHNAEIEEHPDAGPTTNPVVNDENLALQVQAGVEDLFPGHLTKNVQWYASETFAKYSELAPTIFTLVGVRNEALGSGADHHNQHFDMDDDALRYAIGTMTKFAVDYLS